MFTYSITSTQAVWTVISLLALILPWILVRACPPKEPPRSPPRHETPPPTQPDHTDMSSWLHKPPDWLRNEPPITPPLFWQSHQARRAFRMKLNGGTHTRAEWLALCAHYNNRCLCCRRKRPLTKDHVIPIVLGGSDNIDNIQPLCRSCNSSKGTSITDYRPS